MTEGGIFFTREDWLLINRVKAALTGNHKVQVQESCLFTSLGDLTVARRRPFQLLNVMGTVRPDQGLRQWHT